MKITKLLVSLIALGLSSASFSANASLAACKSIPDFDQRKECVTAVLATRQVDIAVRLEANNGDVEAAAREEIQELWDEVEPVLYPSMNRSVITYSLSAGVGVSKEACSTYAPGTPAPIDSCLTAFNAVAYATVDGIDTLVLGLCGAINAGPVIAVSGLCSSMAGIPIPYVGHAAAVSIPVLFSQSSLPGRNCADAIHLSNPVAEGSTRACSSTSGSQIYP